MGIYMSAPQKGVVEFGVTKIPGRKSKALYKIRGEHMEILAYFKTDQQAEEFEKIMDFIADNFGSGPTKIVSGGVTNEKD